MHGKSENQNFFQWFVISNLFLIVAAFAGVSMQNRTLQATGTAGGTRGTSLIGEHNEPSDINVKPKMHSASIQNLFAANGKELKVYFDSYLADQMMVFKDNQSAALLDAPSAWIAAHAQALRETLAATHWKLQEVAHSDTPDEEEQQAPIVVSNENEVYTITKTPDYFQRTERAVVIKRIIADALAFFLKEQGAPFAAKDLQIELFVNLKDVGIN